MASVTRVRMKPGAKRKLRYMAETVDVLERFGKATAAKANAALGTSEDLTPGYRMSSRPGRTRHRVTVMAVSIHARRHDRKHNTLLKSLGNG
jgi:hypothetical protein